MQDTDKKFCSILFDVMEAKGVKDIICSPGSRNVPLLLAAHARKELKKHFVSDERSAAFMALGISLVSKRPVAIICTSGTALLNYAPAVAEAYYQGVPLIVVSADRPIQWIDQDDSQTLRQDGAIANYVKKSYSIPASGENEEEMLWYVNRIANDAMITALAGRRGSVHINVHLSEPLNQLAQAMPQPRLIKNIEADTIGNKEVIKGMAEEVALSKVMLVAGFNTPDSILQKAVAEFSNFPNVTVMAETISNLHLDPENYMIDSVLTAHTSDFLDSIAPDLIISIGGALVSRKLKEYLRRNSKNCRHWSVGFSHTVSDPFFCLQYRIEVEPSRYFRALNSALRSRCRKREIKMPYGELWHEMRRRAANVKDKFIEQAPWSELKAFDIILKNIPVDYNICLSNGTPIRYAQIISHKLPHASYCNRGVSGIDGSVSTAIGCATAYKGHTLLITGDLSMAYDIGALNINEAPQSMKIIVIDNQGGGIFRFIPSTSGLEIREKYLCQDPQVPLSDLAYGYGWEFEECDNEKALRRKLPAFLEDTKTRGIMHITCPGEESAEILKNYMNIKI